MHAQNAIWMSQVPIVFIIDADPLVRMSVEVLIRTAGWQAESFSSAEEFLARPRAMRPGCLVLDVSLPQLDGPALQEIIADRTETPLIFVTDCRDVRTAVRAMKAGAVDFLTKPCSPAAILSAVRCALDRSRLALAHESAIRSLNDRCASLTCREREVLGLVVTGLLNKQIAAELRISEITVKAHRGKMMRKMAAASLAQLVNMTVPKRSASWRPSIDTSVPTDTIVQYTRAGASAVIQLGA